MTHSPRTKDEIYVSLRDSLKNQITKLTNFTDRSFNYVWTQAFSEELRELEVLTLVAELSGYIDYAGGGVTEEDLSDLGVADSVDAQEVNSEMEDQYLDELLKILDLTRDQGKKATGTAEITTQSAQTDIPKGTKVTTEASADGDTLDFVTVSDTSTSAGSTTTTVGVEATEIGNEHNLPPESIVRFSSPPVGVKSVTNKGSTQGGEPAETNEEFRERAKEFVKGGGEGGTTDGIKREITDSVGNVSLNDIGIDEFTEEQPTFVDVVVDYSPSDESAIEQAIEESRPTGIEHNLVEPTRLFIGVRVDLVTKELDNKSQFTSDVETVITNFLEGKSVSDDLLYDEVVARIMEADNDIIHLEFLDVVIDSVEQEQFVYDTAQTEYRLDYTFEDTNGTVTIEDDGGNTYTEGTDYTVEDKTGDGWPETVVWDTTESTPRDRQSFFVDYDVTTASHQVTGRQDIQETRSGQVTYSTPFSDNTDEYLLNYSYNDDGSMTVSDNSGDTYTEGADYVVEDQNDDGWPEVINWSTGTSSPDDGEFFDATYEIAPPDQRGLEVHNTDVVRDEPIEWNSDKTQSFVYDSSKDRYTLREAPVTSTVVVTDDNGNTYNSGDDYYLVDDDADGYEETVDFSMGKGSVGGGGSQPQTPNDGQKFTITYDQAMYSLDKQATGVLATEVTEAGASGTTITKETESGSASSSYWNFVDTNNDGEYDSIYISGESFTDSTELFITYQTEGDILTGSRDKIRAGRINANVE